MDVCSFFVCAFFYSLHEQNLFSTHKKDHNNAFSFHISTHSEKMFHAPLHKNAQRLPKISHDQLVPKIKYKRKMNEFNGVFLIAYPFIHDLCLV